MRYALDIHLAAALVCSRSRAWLRKKKSRRAERAGSSTCRRRLKQSAAPGAAIGGFAVVAVFAPDRCRHRCARRAG